MPKSYPGWRLWLSLAVSVGIGCLISVEVSVRAADRNTNQLIEHARANSAEQHRVACDLVTRILAAYEETPPTTPRVQNVVDAWREEYRILGCLPIK